MRRRGFDSGPKGLTPEGVSYMNCRYEERRALGGGGFAAGDAGAVEAVCVGGESAKIFAVAGA